MTRQTNPAATLTTAGLILFGSLILTTGLSLAQQKKTTAAAKPAAAAAKPSADLIAAGKKIYDANNCSTCHLLAGKGGAAGPDLTHTGDDATHTVQWLSDQVSNPKGHNPGSTMPAFAASIKGKDLNAIGVFLASLKSAPSAAVVIPASTLPPVAPPTALALAKVAKLGGSAGPIAQNDNHLDVSFHLLGPAITDSSMAVLVGLKGAVNLDLGQTGVGDGGLVYVKGLKDLMELHLEGTKVTDAGLANLSALHRLVYLNLYGTGISDAGLVHLAHLTNLRHLYVWQTKVTDDGAAKLKKDLPQLEIIQGFDQTPAVTPAAAPAVKK